MVRSTVYISQGLVRRIAQAACECRISSPEMSRIIIQSMITRSVRQFSPLVVVRHQKKMKNTDRERMRVVMTRQMYERCMDLRKILKVSVSRLFAEEIIRNLDRIVSDFKRGCKDNIYSDTYFMFCVRRGIGWVYQIEDDLKRINFSTA